MKRVLGIFRGFPGLGRVVAGVSLLETLRDQYGYEVKMISYLQGKEYLISRGYQIPCEASPLDYCSIGLLPTNKMGVNIHNTIKEFIPNIIVIDGEPLILHSIKISFPKIKIITLLNPADVENKKNDKESMEYFNALYSLSDLAIVHGLRRLDNDVRYKRMVSTRTILRNEILQIKNAPTNNIYCILGGGTVNVDNQFEISTLKIAKLCREATQYLAKYNMHIICSSKNIYNALKEGCRDTKNLMLYDRIIPAREYYEDACLIITRSGRNTLSELAYLGIPAISFISGGVYREVEQSNNIEDIGIPCIHKANVNMSTEDFVNLCHNLIGTRVKTESTIGNMDAIKEVLKLCE